MQLLLSYLFNCLVKHKTVYDLADFILAASIVSKLTGIPGTLSKCCSFFNI